MPLRMPTLTTERLFIRGFQADDAEARQALMAEAFDSTDSLDETRRWVRWAVDSDDFHDQMAQPGYGDYAVTLRETGELIGAIGLVPTMIPWGVFSEFRPTETPPHTFTSAEYGLFWAVRSHAKGQGYAPEAAQAFIEGYVFEVLRAARVVAMTEFDNLASQRVMEKLAMRLYRNPISDPFWFQVVGVLVNPAL
jgi:RimJ/RimL family protein N-acetyltransferase